MISTALNIIDGMKNVLNVCVCLQETCICRLNRIGICIPIKLHINLICSSLVSDTVQFINLDDEIKIHLNNKGEDSENESKNPHEINKLQFKSANEIVDDFQDIFRDMSNKIKTVVYLSHNYRLLKYGGCEKIYYFCPSESLISTLSSDENFNLEKFNVFKQDLLLRKGNKMTVYSSIDILTRSIQDLFEDIHMKV